MRPVLLSRRGPLTSETLHDLTVLDRPSPQKAREALGVTDFEAEKKDSPLYKMAAPQNPGQLVDAVIHNIRELRDDDFMRLWRAMDDEQERRVRALSAAAGAGLKT